MDHDKRRPLKWPLNPSVQMVKHLPAMWETWVLSLCQEDPLEKEMTTHTSILAWGIPRTEEPGGLQSMKSLRVGLDWARTHNYWYMLWSANLANSNLTNNSQNRLIFKKGQGKIKLIHLNGDQRREQHRSLGPYSQRRIFLFPPVLHPPTPICFWPIHFNSGRLRVGSGNLIDLVTPLLASLYVLWHFGFEERLKGDPKCFHAGVKW